MANKNNFINGITELLILSILNKHDSYVYEIVKSITEFSGGLLSISQNTIYTATYKLENEGKITEQGTHEDLIKTNGLYAKMWTDYNKAIQWKITAQKEVA